MAQLKGKILIACAALLITGAAMGEDMKLINVDNGFVIAEFQEDHTVFYDRFLEAEMTEKGVLIPPALRKEFDGKSFVTIDDVDFQRAFKEVYYKFSMNSDVYQWDDDQASE